MAVRNENTQTNKCISSDGDGQTDLSLSWVYNLSYAATKRRPNIGFQDKLSLIAGQKYCRMLQGEHSAIFSTFINLPFIIQAFILSIFKWPLKTGFTVHALSALSRHGAILIVFNINNLRHKSMATKQGE